ncbi:inositol monophosphatase family protein [Chengkuizengella axinellae]|uniref:Inositol monophosphatase n=1 Tax=Chengkuizengella axinellae TaxID=3064388 RepID=A0ABT9IXW4_9BACL|nr:inositol monophosphatase [Chengkuizengella sp. 2205SS18-9]MDP5274158.1 inositol monophosphatase [Chengkuizengella sp. 2205SS18-9]
MEQILKTAEKVAVDAVLSAGRIAREKFNSSDIIIEEKGSSGDVVTEVDYLAEKEILHKIQEHFPNHQIRSEETGWLGVEGDWLWIVDPLDGTNNFTIGLPIFGVSITLLYKKEAVLGVIYDSMLDKIYMAENNKGAICEDEFIKVKSSSTIEKMTVGWIQGHVVQNDQNARKLKYHLDYTFKRTLSLWAPTLIWAMLARGDIDGVVLYNSEGDDLYSGLLLAKEAGAMIMDFEGNTFEGMNPEPYIIACHPDHKERFLEIVKEGLDEKVVD